MNISVALMLLVKFGGLDNFFLFLNRIDPLQIG